MNAPRIGLGIDLHRLGPDRPCTLGGLVLPCDVGPIGHSDGDAILHAICDAVLGAAGLDDLGSLFPDDAAVNKDRASHEFCTAALEAITEHGLRVASIDVVVECERPKLAPHRPALRSRIGELFDLEAERVNLKGKTGEGVDAIGRGEAVRATAVVLLTDL